MVYAALGIDLPSHQGAYASVEDGAEIKRLMAGDAPLWHRVEPGSERATDGILLNMAGYDWHVGVVTQPGRMLHIRRGRLGSRIEHYDDAAYKRRVRGFYRHERLFDATV